MDQKASRGGLITEEDVHSAVEYLRNSARDLGKIAEREKKAEHMIKVQEGFGYQMAEGASELRKAMARTSPEYQQAVNEYAEAYGEARKLYALREAAAAMIDAWRTQEASQRKHSKAMT